MAKKRFGMDQQTNTAISQVMQMAEEYEPTFDNTVIPLQKIIIDPNNPRKHAITLNDLKNGPSNSDPNYQKKLAEYEGLCELSTSIKEGGLLHPVIVYKNGENYQVVAGERRIFASVIAGKNHIEARVFNNKPNPFDLKIVQWVENESRKDLSLFNRLINVSTIVEALKEKNSVDKITAQLLANTLCISRQLAQNYLSIIQNSYLLGAIKDEKVATLQLARELAKYKTEEELKEALRKSLELRNKPVTSIPVKDKLTKAGRKRTQVSLGKTKSLKVARALVEGVLAISEYEKYRKDFKKVDWTSMDQSTKAIHKLVKILETALGD